MSTVSCPSQSTGRRAVICVRRSWCHFALTTLLLSGPALANGGGPAHSDLVARLRMAGAKIKVTHDRVVEIDASARHLSPNDIAEIGQVNTLESLSLTRTGVGDEGCRALRGLKCLQRLSLSSNQITDDGMKALAHLKQLRELDLAVNSVHARGIVSLTSLKSLRSLTLDYNPITDAAFESLGAFKKLNQLSLRHTNITGHAIRLLGPLPIKVLSLEGAHLDGLACQEIARLSQLRDLDLSGTNIGDECVASLARLKRLGCLDLTRTKVRGPGLIHLKGNSNLVILKLTGTLIDDSSMGKVGELVQVRSLDLTFTPVTDTGLKELSALAKLESIALGGSVFGERFGDKITDRSIRVLSQLKSLRLLEIYDTDVTEAGKKELRRANPKLEIKD